MLDFLLKILLGSAMTVLNMTILLYAVEKIMPFIQVKVRQLDQGTHHWVYARAMAVIMAFLFFGHMLQFATWASLFVTLGEFDNFETAFYHSTVNFTSLGYGDIVMSEKWRLLGALEAANGVLMFGLSAGMFLTVMSTLYKVKAHAEKNTQKKESSSNP